MKSSATSPDRHADPAAAATAEPVRPRRWSRRRLATAAALLLAVLGGLAVLADWWIALPDDIQATYVGSESCKECHAAEYQLWLGSHHELAMKQATPETVRGDFDNAQLTHHGITSRMYRRDGKYFIYTEGPDGGMHEYEIGWVFGYEPLQQYMVEMERLPDQPDHELGRVQVLRVSWDTEQNRWFYLEAPDVPGKLDPSDPLHWTGALQNWNHTCADCHSTDLRKNHNPETNTYHTTFAEIHVGCEACHGPGSIHNQLAGAWSLFWDRRHGYGLPRIKGEEAGYAMMDMCFTCHSRRRKLTEEFRPGDNFYDHFQNELLQANTYYCDGQILDEVYEHGSYTQSLMYEKGVRCVDCHDPHSMRLRYEGNRLCTSCHMGTHPAGQYDAPAHHHHKPDDVGASCIECHMPDAYYMMVDPRRDHSMRIPRPDLSVRLGVPNSCTKCHLDRAEISDERRAELPNYDDWMKAARAGDEEIRRELRKIDEWALEHMIEWYGEKWRTMPSFAYTLQSAWKGEPASLPGLVRLSADRSTPAIIRATAVQQLGQFSAQSAVNASRAALRDPHPLVRATAIANLEALPPVDLVNAVTPLLHDPIRLVRTEAARSLAHVREHVFSREDRAAWTKALEEFKDSMTLHSDQAGSHMALGILYERRGDLAAAEEAYRTALRIQPDVVGPRTNLASVLEQRQQTDEAQRLRGEELEMLERDVDLMAHAFDFHREYGLSAVLHYRYGLALYLAGREEEAEIQLARAVELQPNNVHFLLTLVLLHQKHQRWEEAIAGCRRLMELEPHNEGHQQLLQTLLMERAQGTSQP